MTAYELTCADCGETGHIVRRSDARYCPSCKLLRVLRYCSGKFKRKKRCRACGKPYRPRHARDLSYCAGCEAQYNRKTKPGYCVICKGHDAPLEPGVSVCLYCLKGPEQQLIVLKALDRGKLLRRKANAQALAELGGQPRLVRVNADSD